MTNLKWTDAEKKVARQAFDAALQRELAALLQQVKNRAAKAENPDDIWAINDYLTEQRRAIEEKYDYRYSQLIFVFSRLLRERLLSEADIEGLAEEKLQAIHRIAAP